MADVPTKLPPDGLLASEALKPGKERPISKRMREFIRLLVTGECKTQKAACERTGLHPGSISREMRKAHIQVFIERSARESLANGTMRAGARLMELVDASSEHVSLEATKHVLGIRGIKPTADAQVSVNIDIKAGYVIDLTDAPKVVTDARLTHTIEHDP